MAARFRLMKYYNLPIFVWGVNSITSYNFMLAYENRNELEIGVSLIGGQTCLF